MPDEVYGRWLKKIEQAQAAVERTGKPYKARKAELSQIYKDAKADGVDVDAVKEALKLDKDDHIEVALRYTNTGRVLRLIKSPLGVQMDLFKPEDLPAAISVALEGRRAGRAGASIDANPYAPGTEEFNTFRTEWEKGQGEVRETLRQ